MPVPSSHLVDPELLPVLNAYPPMPEWSAEALAMVRAGRAEQLAALPPPPPLPVIVETLNIPGPAGQVRVLAYRPAQASGSLPAVLHIHGGGYIFGFPEMMDLPNRILAHELACAVYSVDYRLAPETPAPGALEDCYAVLRWLNHNAAAQNINPARIGVKGESAGGGLAAALALLARDRGEVQLAFQHLMYPMIDDRTCTASQPHPLTGQFIWRHQDNLFGWTCLLGHAPGRPGVSPYAAAARAENLEGLPPSYLAAGALDLFLEENLDYARRLTRAGVPVELHVYPGAFHAFDVIGPSRLAATALRDSTEALRRALHG